MLEGTQLRDVATLLASSRVTRRALGGKGDRFPLMAMLADGLLEAEKDETAIGRAVDEAGNVRDDASPALYRLRREIKGARSRLVERLAAYVSSLPAHYQVPFSRLGPYDRPLLDDLIYRKRVLTEQWAHEASILPIEHWPLIRFHVGPHERRWRALAKFMDANAAYADRVLDEVRSRGPLVAGDVAEPDGTRARGGGWWGWTKAKATPGLCCASASSKPISS